MIYTLFSLKTYYWKPSGLSAMLNADAILNLTCKHIDRLLSAGPANLTLALQHLWKSSQFFQQLNADLSF